MPTKVFIFVLFALSSFVAANDVQSTKSLDLTVYQEAKSVQATTNLLTIGLCSLDDESAECNIAQMSSVSSQVEAMNAACSDDPNSSECKSEKAITLFTFLFLLLGAVVKCLTPDEWCLDEY